MKIQFFLETNEEERPLLAKCLNLSSWTKFIIKKIQIQIRNGKYK